MTSINYGEKQREQKSQKEEKEMKKNATWFEIHMLPTAKLFWENKLRCDIKRSYPQIHKFGSRNIQTQIIPLKSNLLFKLSFFSFFKFNFLFCLYGDNTVV